MTISTRNPSSGSNIDFMNGEYFRHRHCIHFFFYLFHGAPRQCDTGNFPQITCLTGFFHTITKFTRSHHRFDESALNDRGEQNWTYLNACTYVKSFSVIKISIFYTFVMEVEEDNGEELVAFVSTHTNRKKNCKIIEENDYWLNWILWIWKLIRKKNSSYTGETIIKLKFHQTLH